MQKFLFTFISLSLLIIFTAGCKTTIALQPSNGTLRDKTVGDEPPPPTPEELAIEDTVAFFDFAPQVVFVEKPIYVPQEPKPAETGKNQGAAGIDSVSKSTDAGTVKPEEYSHAARIYDYDKDQVFEVYTQILRTTDLYLEPGETVVEAPFVSDTERWILGAGISGHEGASIQHIYIKPKEAGLHATMIINTDRRVYHIILRSYTAVYMPMVRWRYPYNGGFPRNFALSNATSNRSQTGISTETEADFREEMEYVDPRYLSFDYQISFSAFRRPKWIPRLVYDDGKKTYIVFDLQILQREMPGIFEGKDNIVNYRVSKELIIIDKLIEKITVKYGKDTLVIEKKKGK